MRMFNKQRKRQHILLIANSLLRIGRLLQLGYPLETALKFIQLHVNLELQMQLGEVLIQLKEGHPVHVAFDYVDIPSSIKSFLYFYERQGQLAEGFTQAGTLLHHQLKMTNELWKLLRYPSTLLMLCGVVLLLMFHFVIPHFQTVFNLMTNTPPFYTIIFMKILLLTPYFLSAFFLLLLCLFVIVQIKWRKWTAHDRIQLFLKFPICRRYVQMIISYVFSLHLGRLLQSGMTLQQALVEFENQNYLPFFREECTVIKSELLQGQPLYEILREKHFFCEELSIVVNNGEKTGYLAADLEHYGDILMEELEEEVQKGLRIVQPALFVVIGGFVFILFLVTMLPLFHMLGTT
ncbi:competence type IV pilus assembly protein ComGB [Halalkalibacter akibai]|uniref:Late competence protein n=1 Tax=Halalkalibacter akibai (strain ATCC 43226 / DSM 21942 / CIP 109018 / JCM 9157 / 1139) TaxID=1236973 RepID=W4QYV3_HALA3|nr:competence type IV pilus assembly protein ComGB [Halalkalibacter akibai]GAE37082.1 late competence protein [Halalkalibacter akibai JCM 9157]